LENNTQELPAVNHNVLDDHPPVAFHDDAQDMGVSRPLSEVADIGEARQRRAEIFAQTEIPDALTSEQMTKALRMGLQAIERQTAREHAKASKETKGKVLGIEQASDEDKVSLRLRYAHHFAACTEIRIGGGKKGRTMYVWNGSEARWVAQDDDEARSHATEWMVVAAPEQTDADLAHRCLKTALDLHSRKPAKRIPEPDPMNPILPVIGAYLRIDDEGVIRASYPDMAAGVTHRVPAKLDWSRVDKETSIYTPAPLKLGSRLAEYLDKFMPDEDVRMLLQEALGSSLMPAAGWHKAFVMSGGGTSINDDGANGKSTFLKMLQALHPENVVVDLTTLDKDASAIADLEGKTLAMSSETPEFLGKQVEVKLKAIIAGDQIRGRSLYCNARCFEPQLSMWISLNGAGIRFQDRSAAMEERFLWIPFNQRIARDSAENIRNWHLLVVNDPAELAVLLDWALEGVARLCRNGKRFSAKPGCLKAADEARRMETDPTYAWMVENDVTAHRSEETCKGDIYAAYRNEMEEQTNRPLASSQFWRALKGFVESKGLVKLIERQPSGGSRHEKRAPRTVNVTVSGLPSKIYQWNGPVSASVTAPVIAAMAKDTWNNDPIF
jgi:hypothetical protein